MASLTALSTHVCPNSWQFIKQQAEKFSQQQNTRETVFEGDLIRHIFGFLSHAGLGMVSRVCKEWKNITSDNFLWSTLNLKNLFPKLQVLDGKVWEAHVDMKTYGLDASGDFPQDKQLIKTLKNFSSLQVESESGITLLTLPRGLTFNKLQEFARSSKESNATQFGYIASGISEEFGDIAIGQTCRVVITNNVLQGSRHLSVAAQQDLLDILGCKLPEMLTVATVVILTYKCSRGDPEPIRLYNDNPLTYTRCLEQISGRNLVSRNLVIGGFNRDGLYALYDNSIDIDNGVTASRKL